LSYTREAATSVAPVLAADVYRFEVDLDTTLVVPSLVLLYLFLLGRHGAPRWRIACFAGAAVLLAIAFWTPVHHLGLHYLLTMHLLQNVILAEWAPLLAVLGVSAPMAAAFARVAVWRAATHPLVALPLWLGNYFAWHAPPVYDLALRHQSSLIHLEHACYFGTGILFWWPLLQDMPRRLPSGARVAYAFAAFVLAAPLGLLLALLPSAVYDFYVDEPTRVWGLSPLADQELAGATMASEQALVLFVVFAFWFRRFLDEQA
jgi:cytochrome c oxidase assembly factor CtaG